MRLLLLLVPLATVACGAPPGPGSCSGTTSMIMTCVDYGPEFSVSQAMQSCAAQSMTFSTSSCTSDNRVGRCLMVIHSGSGNLSQTLNFYSPSASTDAARAGCSAVNNAMVTTTFTPN